MIIPGWGVLTYISYTGMCRPNGLLFHQEMGTPFMCIYYTDRILYFTLVLKGSENHGTLRETTWIHLEEVSNNLWILYHSQCVAHFILQESRMDSHRISEPDFNSLFPE